MRPAGKTACVLFLFILISPLYAEPFPEPQSSPVTPEWSDEDSPPDAELLPEPQSNSATPEWSGEGSPPDDRFFFLEELFLFDEVFPFDEALVREETLPGEETLRDEETLLSGETIRSEESLPAEETFRDEKTLLSEETRSAEESSPSEEPFPGEETPPAAETLLAEETPLDDDYFFFEAPPLIFEVPKFEIRSFDSIFPNFSRGQRRMAMSDEGLRHYFVKDESPTLIPNPDLGIDLLGSVMKKNPSHLIEALVVVPYNEKEFDLLDIYNALGRIEKIKDHPASLGDTVLYVFTESTRIASARNRKAVSDPLPALTLPFSETMYLRLKEINFGNLFIRGDISISVYGITYSMTNFTDVRYFLVPVVRAERFITILYLEPVKEGILIYSMSGFYLPGFIADRVNLTPNINRRIEIFINWITDGLRKQENAATE